MGGDAVESDAGLREQIRALAEQLDKEADGICPRGHYDKKDKAWRVAHVRRRVADDLRAILSSATPPAEPDDERARRHNAVVHMCAGPGCEYLTRDTPPDVSGS